MIDVIWYQNLGVRIYNFDVFSYCDDKISLLIHTNIKFLCFAADLFGIFDLFHHRH